MRDTVYFTLPVIMIPSNKAQRFTLVNGGWSKISPKF